MVSAFEHCDMVAAVLCGITDPARAPRSVCAMGHKWLWNASLGGLPPEEFLTFVDPLLKGFAKNSTGAMPPPIKLPAISRRNGRKTWSQGRHSYSRRRI